MHDARLYGAHATVERTDASIQQRDACTLHALPTPSHPAGTKACGLKEGDAEAEAEAGGAATAAACRAAACHQAAPA